MSAAESPAAGALLKKKRGRAAPVLASGSNSIRPRRQALRHPLDVALPVPAPASSISVRHVRDRDDLLRRLPAPFVNC
jgi:hypothetical protein